MPPLDHAKAHADADNKLVGDEAQKILEMKTAGCSILSEITGMTDKDIKAVFDTARAKQIADGTAPPSITFSAEVYAKGVSGYGWAPDSSVPRLLASVNAYVPGAGPTSIMHFDSGLVGPNGEPMFPKNPPGVCKDLK